jgi:hypothetical protein
MPETPRENKPQVQQVDSIHKGISNRAVPWAIGGEQCPDLLNIDTTDIGKWIRRQGSQPFGGLVGKCGGLGSFYDANQTQLNAYGIWDSKIYRSTGAPDWSIVATGVSLVADRLHQFNEGDWADGAAFRRALYVTQVEPTSSATDASFVAVFDAADGGAHSQSASHAPRVSVYWQARLWIADNQVTGDGNDLAWSELDDGLTYSPANELSIQPGVGGRITGLLPSRDSDPTLIVFKEDAVCAVTTFWGSSSSLIPGVGDKLDTIKSSVKVLSQGAGCVAPRSIQWVPALEGSDALFLARDGIRSLRRSSDDVQQGAGPPLSYEIPDVIARINFDAARVCTSVVFDNVYYLACPFDGAVNNTHIIAYDLLQQSFHVHEINGGTKDLALLPFTQDERVYFQSNEVFYDCSSTGLASTDSGVRQTYRLFAPGYLEDPGGGSIPYTFESRSFTFGNPRVVKKLTDLFVLGSGAAGATHYQTITYNVDDLGWQTLASIAWVSKDTSIDFGGDALVWQQIADNAIRGIKIDATEIPAFRTIKFQLLGGDDYASSEIYTFQVAAQTLDNNWWDNSL